ncbi:tagaturonate epimerase family protein [Paenibacillus sp. MBLB4367]|uniref:tagaturonate epimerase family protein n=1 Tax=Paenibacillus sp. MBLB4367 TaxID=3384767 RepID=UPI003907EABF
MANLAAITEIIKNGQTANVSDADIRTYPASFDTSGGTACLMIKENGVRKLLAAGSGALYEELHGEERDGGKICPLTHANRLALNRHFPYTVPQAFGTQVATIGLGDRLGLAGPGHVQTVRGRGVKPILAQQSIRELTLTGRDYKEVVDAASFAVFQEGYKDGFGADGDHLKAEADIRMALELGFTMLTLDCSEKIDNTIDGLSETEIEAKYGKLHADVREHFEARYLNRDFAVGGSVIRFDRSSLMKNVLIYGEAISFMAYIYTAYIKSADRAIDFEISIDETLTPTDPESHFLAANELYAQDIAIYSMAPRFCGEFQKGIDYIGDVVQFERELIVHAAIADHFGYKLSIHSGSDKFSVFPLIGKHTNGRFHVKTAGTNWLEAVRTVAVVHPDLYRRMHRYAYEHFEEAKAYYHVTTDIAAIKPLDEVSDERLPEYMEDDNARQLIHITYGILLQAKTAEGGSLFKEEFYRTLNEQEEAYAQSLVRHIGKHLDLLGK